MTTERTVTVIGSGRSYAVPDTAVVATSVGHRAANVASAVEGAASAAARALEVAAAQVESDQASTEGFNVWPQHDHQGRPDGFECRHSLTFRCPSLQVAGALVDALAGAVGNRLQVNDVSLVVSDQVDALRLAREAAYADAVAKATHLAGLAGATLGDVLSVAEGGAAHHPFREASSARAAMDTSFAPGQTDLGASLTVTFALAEAG